MVDYLPILVFPSARTILPPNGRSVPPGQLHFPGHPRQVERLSQQLQTLEQDFSRFKASASGEMAGLEPETVLVIEIIGSVNDFKQAVDDTEGLEWLGEWDIENIEASDDFYELPNELKIGVNFFKSKIEGITTKEKSTQIREILKEQGFINSKGEIILNQLSLPDDWLDMHDLIIGVITDKKNKMASAAKKKSLTGRLFLSMSNERGLNELLSLWKQWENGQQLATGKTKWRDVFNQILKIRRWGIKETLGDTGMIDRWQDLLDPVATIPDDVTFQIELFYRESKEKRKNNEKAIAGLLEEIGGQTLGPFIDMLDIAFHAVKAKLPARQISQLIERLNTLDVEPGIQLFKFPGIMYFRPTGQSITTSSDEMGEKFVFPEDKTELPPIVAILDGVPNLEHDALKDRLLLDDPDNLSEQYQPGERQHGSAMASLVVHGDLSDKKAVPLLNEVYHLPVMQPNPKARDFGEHEEYFPDDVFFEDRIERAVRRIFEGDGDTPAQAPSVKIVNISIGDPDRPFVHTPSPWAKLLDWLSFKYQVLFCVSAGNYLEDVNINISSSEFSVLSDDEKVVHLIKSVESQLSERRLLSPAESLNALTIGALHTDESGDYTLGPRIDLLPSEFLFSPISRFGHGFRRSIKPEIYFPGGRQLYRKPILDSDQNFYPDTGTYSPGQQVASDSTQQGELSKTVHTRGTSNATALATRSGARIHQVLSVLQREHGEQIRDEFMAVLIKTLLVHGAKHYDQAKGPLEKSLKPLLNSRRIKENISRYLGYGSVDIERVLACTEQRGTVLGCGEITGNEVHEYRFPLPPALSGQEIWRRMVVTMAWFSPINPSNRNLREAKLSFVPPHTHTSPLKIERVGSDHNQVLRGTVQHEILEGRNQISAYQDGDSILINVTCKADATKNLDQKIPYGLAVTLEVEEGVGIPIYSQIRNRIRPPVSVGLRSEGK